jgi:hypothetical protein
MKNSPRTLALTAVGLATAAFITGCGGGGSTASGPVALTGAVIDGYITGAIVCLDLNSNRVCDSGEPTATSGANGRYTLTAPTGTNLTNLHIIATVPAGAVDSDAPGVPITNPYTMLAPAAMPTVVSPLTTAISAKMIVESKTLSEARIAARNDLALPPGYDFTTDHITATDAGARNVAKVMAAVLAVKVGTSTPNASNLGEALTQISSGGTAAAAYASSDVSSTVNGILGITPPPAGSTAVVNFDATLPTAVRDTGGTGGFASVTATKPAGGGSGSVLRLLRSGGEPYALAVVDVAAIPFTSTRKTLSARVYSPTAGIPMMIKLETTGNTANSGNVSSNETVVVGWQTLTWTFSSIDTALAWTAIVLLPNLDTVDAAPGKEYFFDDVALNAAAAPPPPAGSTAVVNFDTTLPTAVRDTGGTGGFASVTTTPPAGGGSGSALRLLRSGGEPYALAVVDVAAIPFTSTRKTLSARVYSPTAGIPMKVKLETTGNTANSGNVSSNETVVVGWQTLTWTFSSIDTALAWTAIVLLPNLDTIDTAPGKEYFFDDVALNAAAPAPTTSAVVSTGFNADNTTKNSGTWNVYSGDGAIDAGSGGGFGSPSNVYLYINNSIQTYTYQGISVKTPTSSNVSAVGKTTLNYTFGVNPEWFAGTNGAKFAISILANVPGVSTPSCDPEVSTVVNATASADTAYATPLSSFTAIKQDCGNASVTPAQVLAGAIKAVDFKANGGAAAWTINGLTSNTNTTVPAGGLYPTTINVVGGVQFE